MFKKRLLISLLSLTTALSIGVAIPLSISKNNNIINLNLNAPTQFKNDIFDITNTLQNPIDDNNFKKLIPMEYNTFMQLLSTENGPVVFYDNYIISLDWFGGLRWYYDTKNVGYGDDIQPYIKRQFANWTYDFKHGIIWCLTTSNNGGRKQKIFALQANDGTKVFEREFENNDGAPYYFISVLDNGNIMVYGAHEKKKIYIFDIKKDNFTLYNDGTAYSKQDMVKPGPKRVTNNIIPIAPNINILSMSTYGDKSDGSVWFAIVDDQMNFIKNNNFSNEWKETFKKISKPKNWKDFVDKSFYKLIDGRIITIVFDKILVIYPQKVGQTDFIQEISIGNYNVRSYSFDANENLYMNIKDHSEIVKVVLPKNHSDNAKFSIYYDLKNSPIEEIKQYASEFILYNVYGYTGQIMLLKPYKRLVPGTGHPVGMDYVELPTNDQVAQNKYGLSVAITSNSNSGNSGDTKGLLNTEKAFERSSDFTISDDILKRKLPSEITRNDLDLLYNSFLTKNNQKNPNGTLKYIPFEKNDIDDKNKTFNIKVNLDQIPWFVTDGVMPTNINPTPMEKRFTSSANINDRVTWKDANSDYDFRNTLPSKLTIDDVKRINPFIINLTSQSTTISGEKYPKLEYRIKDKNDSNGDITIEAKYQYLPMDVGPYKSNIKEFISEKKYTIFKLSDSKNFEFVGGNNNTNISQIIELKELMESNILPSTYENLNNQEFLKFIDTDKTKGYPISKMKISAISNDNDGTLEITIDPKQYDNNLNIINKKFIGFNKIGEYSFLFDTNPNQFNKKLFRPSDITDEMFYDKFIKYTGFDSSDMNLTLLPNDEKGTLFASVKLVTEYAQKIIEKTPFKLDVSNNEYTTNMMIDGFKTTNEFNNDFQLVFKKNDSPNLVKAQELTPSEIINAFSGISPTNSITVDKKTYTNKYDFVKDIFIEKNGNKLPDISEKNKDKIFIDFFANNSGGEITVKIEFKNIEGYDTDLVFIQLFNGFSRGNDLITDDVLVFKNEMQLVQSLKNIYNNYPSIIAKYLKDNPTEIKHFLNTYTNDYEKLINSNMFELIIDHDNMFGTLIITIKFSRNDVSNSDSLLQYSQIYRCFKKY